MKSDIVVVASDTGLATADLSNALGIKMQLRVDDKRLTEACVNLAGLLARFFLDSNRNVRPGETIDWASSLLKVYDITPDRYELRELAFDGVTLKETVDETVRIWCEQSEVCSRVNTPLAPTRFGDYITLSPGVLGGGPIEGIRYPAPSGTSGWWLFTPEYNGDADNFKSMEPTHVFHVLHQRRDLARFLGLGVGFAFEWDNGAAADGNEASSTIWFESEVASQPIP